MPKQEEIRLKIQAKKKGLKPGTKEYNAYVYGTLYEKFGWRKNKK